MQQYSRKPTMKSFDLARLVASKTQVLGLFSSHSQLLKVTTLVLSCPPKFLA